jgi:hypothetical protein
MHWTYGGGEHSIRSKHSSSFFASTNWAVKRPIYRVSSDPRQSRGNDMGLVQSWFKKLLSSDHRKAERQEAPQLVAYYWDGSVPTAHKIRNISSTGFYLLTTERWHPGTMVTMTLQRTDILDAATSSEGYITVLSKVIRLDKDGVGFVFVPIADKSSGGTDGRMRGAIDRKALVRFMEHVKVDKGHAMRMHVWKCLEERYEKA